MKKGIKEEIIEKLLNEGYGNKSISYLEFLVLFQEYKGRILESQFNPLRNNLRIIVFVLL